MSKIVFIEQPKNFSFRHTIDSHGWLELSPFKADRENWFLSYVFTDENAANPTLAAIAENAGKLRIEIADDTISKKFEEKIRRDVRHILRLDDDLSEFYHLIKPEKTLSWIAARNAGRLLRSPTVFEDLVKTICTTNCSWALTKKMTANIVEKLGQKNLFCGIGGKSRRRRNQSRKLARRESAD